MILETMPMTEKVEELLHVIGPFYEIVEDKKSSRSSDLTSVRLEKVTRYLEDLGNVLSSTPKVKTVNGKAESSDSGAESEEEEAQEEVKETKQSKKVMPESPDNKDLEIVFTNGYDKDSVLQDVPNDNHADSSLNGSSTEEVKNGDQNLKQTGQTAVSSHQGTYDDHVEDISGIQHLTSDSDSEVYCDSMEQFGQEESLEIFSSNKGPFRYSSHYLGGDHSQLLENSGLPEEVCISPGNLHVGDMQKEGKGEVKHGGEDGRPSGGAPQREKRGGEKEEFSGVRRGRGHRMQHLGDGLHSGHMGSGGDGERWGSDRGSGGSLNEQIAVALMRLQEDMKNVLQRLHTLETLAASQAKSPALQTDNRPPSLRPSWWPFEMSPTALTFAIVWPFIAQWLVHLYYQRRRRKLN
ncbi:acyl-CoA-binding domain-containing protein 5 isoform X3 [Dromiciops gliroides]|uniref:acyl-CoA-binding domain-containing protein 5 isoform X3 n=1 Tax=Dromiciops gliroides TaxID=33562 RepID=UPI001CC518AC|nr:acyl-CoA-binding domain-containing protein 5 isoform X3 [Dromiciops gliroides]